jgi:hypothetical protein
LSRVGDRHHADQQVDKGGHVVALAHHTAVEAFIEEKVGVGGDGFPGGELARLQVGAQAGVVLGRLLHRVEVVTALAAAGFAVGAEQFLELVEDVGLGAEVGEVLAAGLGLRHGLLHGPPLEAVEAVPFHHRRDDALPGEDVLEGPFHGAGSRSGGTGDSHDRVTLRHRRRGVQRL